MINPEADLEKELSADYRVYGLAAKHRDIGRRLGELYGLFGPTKEQMHPQHVAFARHCRQVLGDVYAPLVEEIDATAAGAGKAADDVLWHYCLDVGAPAGSGALPLNNCTTVGVMTSAGPVIARNYDFFYFESFRHLVTTYAEGAIGHTGMWTGLAGGRYDGVNAKGVWISMHGGGGRQAQHVKPGIAFYHLCRIVLETCATAQEGVDLLTDVPHIASYNFFVADAKEMFVVEAHPERVRVRQPEDGVLVCTNHPVHPEMVDWTESPILDNSRRRMEFLRGGARWAMGIGDGLKGAVAVQADDVARSFATLMRDHTVPVCGHTDGLATFWSALCVPQRRAIRYSLGAPCRNDYVDVTWP